MHNTFKQKYSGEELDITATQTITFHSNSESNLVVFTGT